MATPAEAKSAVAPGITNRPAPSAPGPCLRRQGPFCGRKGRRAMPTAKKLQIVEELKEQITRSTIIIGAEYKGLRVSEVGALRPQLGAKGGQVRVTKNTLLRLAAAAAGKPAGRGRA